MRCRFALKATVEGIDRHALRRSRAVTFSSLARCLAMEGWRHTEVPLCPEGDGRGYPPTRPAQKPRGDFVVAGEMPGNGQWAA